jgi:hypothetical protein
MIPLFFVGILAAFVGYHLSKESSASPKIGGPTPSNRPMTPSSYLQLLAKLVRSGIRPSEWVVSCAVTEAFEKGDWRLADAIALSYPSTKEQPLTDKPPAEESKEEVPASSIAFEKQSPIQGLKDDDWNEFVTALATEKEDLDTPTHRGIFYHSKKRLSQLGVKEMPSEADAQYEVLVKDILDLNNRFKEFILGKSATTVDIKGKSHAITASGLLGLLKSGGPKGAEAWLSNPDDRVKFPKTTEVFLRCNGLF